MNLSIYNDFYKMFNVTNSKFLNVSPLSTSFASEINKQKDMYIKENLEQVFQNKFSSFAMNKGHTNWKNSIARVSPLQSLPFGTNSDFANDKKRILFSEGFERLRYKTQVFPICENDMVTTRSSHVLQVAELSKTICDAMGLNSELADAIALGHDLGHAPFGHEGERALRKITEKYNLPKFIHEKNSLRMIDKFYTYKNSKGEEHNFDLTYAVRDGIVNHCGEVDANLLKPSNFVYDLDMIEKVGQYQPYTWEGIVVKISDKIAYLGKDIEDATRLGILNENNQKELVSIVKKYLPDFDAEVNNLTLSDIFIADIVKNSSPQKGIGFSENINCLINEIKKYNYENIYKKPNVRNVNEDDVSKILNSIFIHYSGKYNGINTIRDLNSEKSVYEKDFKDWLIKYSNVSNRPQKYKNNIIYDLNNINDYNQAIVDFISGMTDKYAIKTYNSFSKSPFVLS